MPTAEQIAAYAEVAKALRDGRLTPASACERCGHVGRLNAHHDHGYDVEHRLDIEWLCHPCHRHHHGAQMRGVKKRPYGPRRSFKKELQLEREKWLKWLAIEAEAQLRRDF